MSGKFDSARDEALYVMSVNGWANQSSGNVEAPTGYFSLICNSRAELPEILDAFETEFASIDGFAPDSLIGNFIMEESEIGFVYVTEFPSEYLAGLHYTRQDETYAEWEAQ